MFFPRLAGRGDTQRAPTPSFFQQYRISSTESRSVMQALLTESAVILFRCNWSQLMTNPRFATSFAVVPEFHLRARKRICKCVSCAVTLGASQSYTTHWKGELKKYAQHLSISCRNITRITLLPIFSCKTRKERRRPQSDVASSGQHYSSEDSMISKKAHGDLRNRALRQNAGVVLANRGAEQRLQNYPPFKTTHCCTSRSSKHRSCGVALGWLMCGMRISPAETER
jgi:hypothetical protein